MLFIFVFQSNKLVATFRPHGRLSTFGILAQRLRLNEVLVQIAKLMNLQVKWWATVNMSDVKFTEA